MNSQPLVSAIIPVYNGEGYIEQALESIFVQNLSDIEILVIDDGSTDGSWERLQRYRDRIRLFRQLNSGVAMARNHGLKNASGAYITFLDADDLWLPDKTERQLAFLNDHPEYGVCYGRYIFFDENGEISARNDKNYQGPTGWILNDILLHIGFIGVGTMMVRRECVAHTGGFNEGLVTGEDTNWCMRLAHDFQFGFLPGPVSLYRVHAGGLTKQPLKERGTIKSLDNVVELYPELHPSRNKIVREAYAIRHMLRCRALFREGLYDRSRTHGISALRYRPMTWQAWRYLLLSMVPAPILSRLRKATGRACAPR